MKNYELTYLISPNLSEEELKSFQGKINSFIQEEGGVLIRIGEPLRKNLAFPIKKNETAFLGGLDFQLNPDRLESFEKKMKGENMILRYIILTKKLTRKILAIPKKPKRIAPRPKVELEEIEKKLEEILGET